MSKKCTRLWREAHFEAKMYKTHNSRTTFGRSDVVSRGRRKGLCTCKTWGFCSIFNYNHHYTTTLHSNALHYNYTSLGKNQCAAGAAGRSPAGGAVKTARFGQEDALPRGAHGAWAAISSAALDSHWTTIRFAIDSQFPLVRIPLDPID